MATTRTTGASVVLSAVDKTAQAFNSIKGNLSGLEKQGRALSGVFGVLVPAASAAGIVAYVKSVNDGVDALNDLKDATGSSIENISALERVADRTGSSIDVVGSALVKFNQLLNEATPGSAAEQSLRAIGLEAQELRKLDPSEALRRYSVALAGFADDGNKARIVQDQLGRSYRELAPFLNDLAESGQLVAKVTTEQAAEADKFNKQLFLLQSNAKDAARSIVSVLVPALNQAFSDIKTFSSKKELAGAASDVVRLKKELDGLQEQRSSPLFPTSVIENRISEVSDKLELAKRKFRELDAQINGSASRPIADASDASKPTLNFNPDAERKAAETAKKVADAARKEAEVISKAQDAIIAAKIAPLVAAAEAQVNSDFETAQKRARDLIADNDAAFEDFRDKFKGYSENITETTTSSMRELDSAARDIGFTFSSAFEDAVIGGESFRNVLQGIGDDIMRIILRRQVTEPLANAVSSVDWGSIFGFAKGGVMSPGGPLPLRAYASGGIASSPQLAVFGEGSMNEAFVPLPDGRRIPVDLNGGGGGGANVVVNVIEAPGRGGEQSSRQEGDTRFIEIFVEQIEGRMASRVQRGDGPLPVAMERTYGLNRSPGSY